MTNKAVKIINTAGMHARPAADFARCAKGFGCTVKVQRENEPGSAVNGKSVVMLLSQGFACGERIEIITEGENEAECAEALGTLVEKGFDEVR